MADGIIILFALYFYSQAGIEFKKIAFTVLLYFVVSDVTYHYFFLEFRLQNKWPLYLMYNVINVTILFRLDYLKSHNAIKMLISLNILLNIVQAFYFITTTDSHFVYNMYKYIAIPIAILALIYMGLLRDGAKYLSIKSYNNAYLARVLCNRRFHFFRGDLV